MLVDAHLMAELQRTSAGFTVDVAEAFRALDPADPSRWEPLGSGAMVSWGPERFVNRAIGASLDDLGDSDLDRLEAFYEDAGAPASIEVLSWAEPALLARLAARRFQPIRFVDVLVIDAARQGRMPPGVTVRSLDESSHGDWRDAFVEGFATTPDDERRNRELTGILPTVPRSVHLIADADGEVAGCGSLYPQRRIGWVGGGATRPAFRRRGVQQALLAERLAAARRAGCDVVAATANAGGDSSRNMQRVGFTLAATVTVMTKLS